MTYLTIYSATRSAVAELDGITYVYEVTGDEIQWVKRFMIASEVPVAVRWA